MEPRNEKNVWKTTTIVCLIVLAVVIALIAGWMIGRDDKQVDNKQSGASNTDTEVADQQTSAGRVTDLVEFDVPGGWKQAECEGAEDVIYFIPSSETPDCSSVPAWSITLAVDPQSRKDCNQLQNVQNVSKHICKSIFIDNHKTLQAQTVYNQDSSVLPNRTVDAYYIDTGKGVVVARYIHDGSADHGTTFNDLVMGLRVRG